MLVVNVIIAGNKILVETLPGQTPELSKVFTVGPKIQEQVKAFLTEHGCVVPRQQIANFPWLDGFEYLPYFVETNERTERFGTTDAARLFMETHCRPWKRDGNAERIVKTNFDYVTD